MYIRYVKQGETLLKQSKMVNLKFKISEFKAETRNLKPVFITKKAKLGFISIYKKFKAPKIIEIEGERFDLDYTEQMPLSGIKLYYSNVIRFRCNHSEGVEPKTAIFW